jgi:phage shock protein A
MFWTKIMTLFRASAHEAEQAVIDANALRILDQEIRDAAAAVRDATQELTALMAREIQDRRAMEAAAARVVEHERYARKALDNGDETLALEIAGAIADAERDRDRHRDSHDAAGRQIARLRLDIGRASTRIADLKRELAAARSRAAVQRAEGLVARHATGAQSALAAAEETLGRIRELQTDRADRLAAAQQLQAETDGTALKDKLRVAGITEPATASAQAVLARLKAAMKGGDGPAPASA